MNIYNGSLIVPFTDFGEEDAPFIYADDGDDPVHYVGVKSVVNEKPQLAVYDELGNAIYAGQGEGLYVSYDYQYYIYRKAKEVYEAKIRVDFEGGFIVKKAVYNLDMSVVVTDLVEDQYLDVDPDSGEVMYTQGHKEIVEFVTGGYHRFYNTDTHKYISSVLTPTSSYYHFVAGDYYVFQYSIKLEDRAESYDYYKGTSKYDLVTKSFNYMTGELSEIETKLVFGDDCNPIFSDKGIAEYNLIGAEVITADRSLDKTQHEYIVDGRLNVLADVTTLPFTFLRRVAENRYSTYSYSTDEYTIYNEKLEELVTFHDDLEIEFGEYTPIAAFRDGSGKWGFMELDSRIISEPKYDHIYEMFGCYLVDDDDNYGIIRFEKVDGKYKLVQVATYKKADYSTFMPLSMVDNTVIYVVTADLAHTYLINVKDASQTEYVTETGYSGVIISGGSTYTNSLGSVSGSLSIMKHDETGAYYYVGYNISYTMEFFKY